MKKRIGSLALCLCLVCALLATTAAADGAGSVTIGGTAISLATPYYFEGGAKSEFPTNNGNNWIAYLEKHDDAAYTLHLQELTLSTGEPQAIQTSNIAALYLDLQGDGNSVITTSTDDGAATIRCENLIVCGDGSLTATAAEGHGIRAASIRLQYSAKLTVQGDTAATNVPVNCSGGAQAYQANDLAAGGEITNYFSEGNAFESKSHVSFTPRTDARFPIWVNNVQVTASNRDDVLNNGAVSYIPAAGFSPAVLSLNGATAIAGRSGSPYAALYSDEPLRLVLTGANTLSTTYSAAATVCGIYVSGDLAIEGAAGASLTATGTSRGGAPVNCYGVYTAGSLTISGVTLDTAASTGNGDTIGIYAKNGVSVTGSSVQADGDHAIKTDAGGGLHLTDCALLTPAGGTWSAAGHGVVDSAGQPASRVKIGPQPVNMAAIGGVTAPKAGKTPVTMITDCDQYTGSVTWMPADTAFGYATGYTATITLTPKPGYTLTGVAENLFTVAGATTVTSAADSGVITAVFPATARAPSSGGGVTTYPVTLPSAVDGGTVSVSPKNASAGTKITITPKPDDGKQADRVTVTDSKGNAVALTENPDGTFSFKQPSGGAKLSVSFKDQAWANPFADVKESDWFCGDVRYVFEQGLMNGVSDTAFSPNTATTRGMIVTILWRMAGSPAVNYAMTFTDVPGGAYCAEAVRWAAANGIVGGYGNGRFGPGDAITREQMAAILYRYAKYKGYDVAVGESTNILSYNDAFSISEYAIPAIQWACGAGILQGNDGDLMPASGATRAQTAAMLTRFLSAAAAK